MRETICQIVPLLFLIVRAGLRLETLKAGRTGAYFSSKFEDGGQQPVGLERLAQHARRPLEGGVGELVMAVCGDGDDRQVRPLLFAADAADEVDAAHGRRAEVCDEEVRVALVEHLQRLL